MQRAGTACRRLIRHAGWQGAGQQVWRVPGMGREQAACLLLLLHRASLVHIQCSYAAPVREAVAHHILKPANSPVAPLLEQHAADRHPHRTVSIATFTHQGCGHHEAVAGCLYCSLAQSSRLQAEALQTGPHQKRLKNLWWGVMCMVCSLQHFGLQLQGMQAYAQCSVCMPHPQHILARQVYQKHQHCCCCRSGRAVLWQPVAREDQHSHCSVSCPPFPPGTSPRQSFSCWGLSPLPFHHILDAFNESVDWVRHWGHCIVDGFCDTVDWTSDVG